MIIPSGRACMHTADLQTRCGPQAHQWHGYFLMGFEAWCITQKKKKSKLIKRPWLWRSQAPVGNLLVLNVQMLCKYLCLYPQANAALSAFIREVSFCSQQWQMKELRWESLRTDDWGRNLKSSILSRHSHCIQERTTFTQRLGKGSWPIPPGDSLVKREKYSSSIV